MIHFLLCLGLCASHPLDRLEQSARKYTVWESRYDMPAGDSRAGDLWRLGRIVRTVLGVVVVSEIPPEVEAEVHAAGVTMRHQRLIALSKDLSPNAQMQVLAHEAGHVLQPPGLTDAEGQVFADAVSFLLTRDDVEVYGRYLAGYKSGLGVLKTHRREIEWAVTVLRGR